MSQIEKSRGVVHTVMLDSLRGLGRSVTFTGRMLAQARPSVVLFRQTMQQIYLIGVRSLVIIMTCGFFLGLVLGLQFYEALVKFGATDAASMILGKTLFRELGPVLTALLFAGRAGTAIAAEIGLMRATEQLSAMELMAIDPIERIALPRFIAGLLAVPVLTALLNVTVLLGGLLYIVGIQDVANAVFWGNMREIVDFSADYMNGFWKSMVFGGLVSLVAVFQGYYAKPTGQGVGQATTQTVVVSAIMILIVDFIMSAFFVG